MTEYNKGELFKVDVKEIREAFTKEDDNDVKYVILLTFKAINIADILLLTALKAIYPEICPLKVHDSYMFNLVNGRIDDEVKYLEELSERILNELKRMPGWGTSDLYDGQTIDDFHGLD